MSATAPGEEANWFGQPRGLTILFLTEMWEKFSFYGMRAILVFYMVRELGLPQASASLIYGIYTAFIYFTPILGGAVSDRWLSRRTAVVVGGSIMALGHFMMTFPALFGPALATIALGNGLYLPNLPSQIPLLYAADDPRRGGAFNVYYVGVNLGAFLAPLVCGTLGELYGWHYGFAAAGIGMVIGLLTYVVGQPLLPAENVFRHAPETDAAAYTAGPGRIRLLVAVGVAVVIFRVAYEQIGNTVALWAESDIDRSVGAFVIPASWFQSLNALLVFVLTPLIVAAWARAARRGRATPTLRKMACGGAGLAGSYLLLVLATWVNTAPHWLWLAAFVACLTAAELYILPVGLGLFARLAPARRGATTIAAWFLAAFVGNLLAGWLGSFWMQSPHPVFFAVIATIAGLSAVALVAIERASRASERVDVALAEALS